MSIYLFRHPDYVSETTQFLASLHQQRPTLEAEQKAGRALLWDKQINREAQADAAQARVPQKPYVYQIEGE